ncbi:MAG TPA: AAA family ATPase [Thermoanaerobaculia bacterium]|nr:AAA family ATPase [Thermoanaerobaculia bacterium]
MKYTKLFNPGKPSAVDATLVADQSDGHGYVFSDRIVLAVNTAMATGRPLLVRGDSGTGKSSLAAAIATQLRRRKLERVISSRTEARDLLWEIDHLRRLQDAHDSQSKVGPPGDYAVPGILWWAFHRESAEKQYQRAGGTGPRYEGVAPQEKKKSAPQSEAAVVLLDEIDKADPDLPNNLLVPLGSLKFLVEPTQEWVVAKPDAAPLLVITSNDERELPAAFLRRCVELVIEAPSNEQLLLIAERRFPKIKAARRKRVLDLILGSKPADWQGRDRPVPAEYLDALRAVANLDAESDADADELLTSLAPLLVWKASQNVRT